MINTSRQAYRAGFASGFVANSNEILERRKFVFAETSVREEKKMRDEFHKGYYLCQELIRKVNLEKMTIEYNPHLLEKSFEQVKPVVITKESVVEILDNLIYNSDLRKMKDILSKRGYSGIDF